MLKQRIEIRGNYLARIEVPKREARFDRDLREFFLNLKSVTLQLK